MDSSMKAIFKSWVDNDLQEPMIVPASPTIPSGVSCCENKFVDHFVNGTSKMLNKPIVIGGLLIMSLDLLFYLLVSFQVISLGSDEVTDSWLNLATQVFVGLFTFGCISIFPRKLRDLVRLYQIMKTSNVPNGTNWEGETSPDIFDYIGIKHRICITVFINLMCIFEFVNQAARWHYFSYGAANKNDVTKVFTNSFFILAVACGLIALIYKIIMITLLRIRGDGPSEESASSTPTATTFV